MKAVTAARVMNANESECGITEELFTHPQLWIAEQVINIKLIFIVFMCIKEMITMNMLSLLMQKLSRSQLVGIIRIPNPLKKRRKLSFLSLFNLIYPLY